MYSSKLEPSRSETAGRSNNKKSVIDGSPSAPRSEVSNSSRRSKNCSVKRTCRRSDTLAPLRAKCQRCRQNLRPKRLRYFIPRSNSCSINRIRSCLGGHHSHLSRRERNLFVSRHSQRYPRRSSFGSEVPGGHGDSEGRKPYASSCSKQSSRNLVAGDGCDGSSSDLRCVASGQSDEDAAAGWLRSRIEPSAEK